MWRGYSRKALRAFVVGWGVAFPPGDGAGLLAESPTGFLGGGEVSFSYRAAHFPPRHLWRGGGRQAGGEVAVLPYGLFGVGRVCRFWECNAGGFSLSGWFRQWLCFCRDV